MNTMTAAKTESFLVSTRRVSDKKLYIESYGCQMNFADSEVVASILADNGFTTTKNSGEASVILMNTCSIRENAETRVRNRLKQFQKQKRENPGLVIGVLGCMAERLKKKLLEEEKLVDLVAGPDAYRDLPNLINTVKSGRKAVNVLLSREETYAEINPVRLSEGGVSAFISIMRGCDNMCSFCVVPFTRGRERSRDPQSIISEAEALFSEGYREITLLGQNVDSYRWNLTEINHTEELPEGHLSFAGLLGRVAQIHPDLRIRFSTSHPKDMTDDVLHIMAKCENICKYIHLPVQSGNSDVLKRMNRGYSRDQYLERIAVIRNILPEAGLSTDIITGFCGETDDEFSDTLSLMEEVRFDYAYMFAYSERPNTLAERKYDDDISAVIKNDRLNRVISLQRKLSLAANKKAVGSVCRVLIEGRSKRSPDFVCGRNSQNAMVILPKENFKPGDYATLRIVGCNSATLFGETEN